MDSWLIAIAEAAKLDSLAEIKPFTHPCVLTNLVEVPGDF